MKRSNRDVSGRGLQRRRSRHRMSHGVIGVVLCGLILLVALPSAGRAMADHSASRSATRSSISDSVMVTEAWARPALKGGTGGVYMTITNTSHSVVRIVSAASSMATAAELHVSTVHNGMANMEMLPSLVVTAGASVSLKPGGTHVMLVGLRQALVKGDTIRLTLGLQNGGPVVVNIAVRTQ